MILKSYRISDNSLLLTQALIKKKNVEKIKLDKIKFNLERLEL
jgi:hypothetical protein